VYLFLLAQKYKYMTQKALLGVRAESLLQELLAMSSLLAEGEASSATVAASRYSAYLLY